MSTHENERGRTHITVDHHTLLALRKAVAERRAVAERAARLQMLPQEDTGLVDWLAVTAARHRAAQDVAHLAEVLLEQEEYATMSEWWRGE